MSIQWTVIAGYLYFEIAIVILMMLPIFSPRRWHQFFKSRLFTMFQQHAAMYFYVLLGVLSLFLMDAIREMRKYSHGTDGHVNLATEMKGSVKLFRAQRNFYITSFSIFLAFVIRRLVTMLIIQDELSIKAEKIIKEAEATVKLAKNTVLENQLQVQNTNDENQLIDEQNQLIKDLKDEVNEWKQKYEDLSAKVSNGKGDSA